MNLPFFFAWRYLFAKKSHNVINIISAISAVGMATGTAALIIILSIYNGFDSLVRSMMNDFDPDILISPAEGKTFIPEGPVYDWIYEQDMVKNMSCVITENVFMNYDGKQGMVTAKGVDWVFEEESPVRDHIRSGEFALHRGDVPLAVTGSGIAYRMGINPRFLSPIELYFPARDRNFSMTNPLASIEAVNVWPSGIFSISSEIDDKYVIVPTQNGGTMALPNPYCMGNAWFVNTVRYADNANQEIEMVGETDLRNTAVADRRFEKVLDFEAADSAGAKMNIALSSYEPNMLVYETDNEADGVAVFSEIYYPDWTATIDGQPAEIARVNYILRAMRIPAGRHTVTFTFDPVSIKRTEATAYSALAILVLGAAWLIARSIMGRKAKPKADGE